MKIIHLIILFLASISAVGQRNAIRLQLDNDWFTDQYYSAGFEMSYFRQLADANSDKNRVFSGRYGFKIFTPDVHDEDYDPFSITNRPFAGFHYLSAALQNYPSGNQYLEYGLSAGLVGPQTGVEDIQRVAHVLVGYEEIPGWEKQIPNETTIDASFRWMKEWSMGAETAASMDNKVHLGTGNNYFQVGGNIRLGKFNQLRSSSWQTPGVKTGASSGSKSSTEAFVVAGLRMKYVLSNIFLEGSLFDNPSPVSVTPKDVFWESDLGLYISFPKTTYALIAVFQGQEYVQGDRHFYINFNIGFSF